MRGALRRYIDWLHLRWPAGRVERLPRVREDGSTNVPGLYVVGDLTGVPLLKFAADTGARAARRVAEDLEAGGAARRAEVLDLAIVGAGVSGLAAALEARARGLRFRVLEAVEPLSTIVNFPRGKPIFTYPGSMTPAGELVFSGRSDVKEGLLEELREQTLGSGIEPVAARAERVRRRGNRLVVEVADGDNVEALRVIVAIGRSGNFRRLEVPGEDLDKVYNRLHDPGDFRGKRVLVVGGGDSATETAIALTRAGAEVTLSYRGTELGRPKPENVAALRALASDPGADVGVESPASERTATAAGGFLGAPTAEGSLQLVLGSEVEAIRNEEVVLRAGDGTTRTLPNDAVFPMIGREAPLGFFRRSGVRIAGEWTAGAWLGLAAFLAFCGWLFPWKTFGFTADVVDPARLVGALTALGPGIAARASDPTSLLFTLKTSASRPSFYYTLAYSLCVVIFGVRRIRRRRTPYVTVQTLTLMAIQVLPLFVLPEILLPWMGRNGWFDGGPLGWIADQLFPATGGGPGERSYWRAYGLILAWPLMVYNWFTAEPLWGWLVLGAAQTFVLIPAIIFYWGKGAYCGWICSCGALAETLGDAQRHKMPHGPAWNRLNLTGQVILAVAVLMMALRAAGWALPAGSPADAAIERLFSFSMSGYRWGVDLLLAGILGIGLYFHFSGRVWCRFACPLAALMHVYARFSRFRILAEKKRCISCNVCTAVCHQGIDVMSFANKGRPMEDPECVRCSACVQSCPTGVLQFGQIDRASGRLIRLDGLTASPVLRREAAPDRRGSDPDGLRGAARAAIAIVGILFVGAGALLTAQAMSGGSGGSLEARRAGAQTAPATRPSAATQPAAAPEATAAAPGSATEPAAAPDHAAWDGILRRTVEDERIDYLAVRDRHGAALRGYLDRMALVDAGSLGRDARMAFYINLYNATMVQAVVDRWRPDYSPAEDDFAVFREPLVRLGGRTISLDELEKGILLPTFDEPRLHVALVCAAVSCPPLIPRAYRRGDLDAVLEANMTRFVNDPRRNRIEPDARRMRLSRIFDWYADDFGGPAAVPGYVNRYFDGPDVRGFDVGFLEYSWELNDVPR